jgi:serine/threonine protein kinase
MADSDDRARLEARLGKTLREKWKLDRLIGIGGMAAVYAASHRNGAEAAIKILHAQFARRTDARTRFLREAYIANKIGSGAVRVIDDDVDDDGSPYLVMDLLHGEPVETRAKRFGGKLPTSEVLWIASEVLATLEHAHAQGIIHRDLKPDNLFWTTKEGLKVLDFGVARLRDSNTTETTRTGTVVGTPTFMAPEQAIGSMSEIDGRSDLWSMGAIMFRLLTGRHVHPAAQTNALVTAATKRAPPIASVDPSVPADVAQVVDTALQFEREKRYATARAMRDAIDALRGPESEQARPSVHRVSAVFDAPPSPGEGDGGDDAGLATGMSHDDSVALQGILALVEEALYARSEYGAGHPKTIRKVDIAYRQTAAALAEAHIGLFWNVIPEGFVARDQLVWAAKAAAPRAPAAMFAGGVRMIGLLPGLTKPEFVEVVRMIAGDLSPFSDFATFLHDGQLPHVVHRIDPTRPGTPEHASVSIEPTSSPNVGLMLSALQESEDGALRVTLLSRLERWGEGHEQELGAVLDSAGVELAMGLLRVLHVLGTVAAFDAIEKATSSPHSIVRVVALTYLDAQDRLARELGTILDDPDAHARFDALVSIEKYRLVLTAPALAAHIRASTFDERPVEERRQALSALGAVAPAEAEWIAVEILARPGDVAPEQDSTREVAAELLGSIGESPEARAALESLLGSAPPDSALHAAAGAALGSFEARVHPSPAG